METKKILHYDILTKYTFNKYKVGGPGYEYLYWALAEYVGDLSPTIRAYDGFIDSLLEFSGPHGSLGYFARTLVGLAKKHFDKHEEIRIERGALELLKMKTGKFGHFELTGEIEPSRQKMLDDLIETYLTTDEVEPK